jgi:DNA polymerase III subunit alpha
MSASRPFVHLHCHTHYSLLDGANKIPELLKKVKENGMDSVAITDHGNLYGAMDFYNQCKLQEVKPIIGFEAYIAPGKRQVKKAARMKEASFHLTLLAMNATGVQNLMRLSSKAFLEGFYYKPRIDKEILEQFNEGLICLTGCAASELSQHILSDRMKEAKELTVWYEKVFGDRVYMEIQNAGLEIQKECAEGTIDIANQMGLPLIATNDAHYLNQEDADSHDILLCVNTRSLRSDEKRMRMSSDQFFVRTPEEMYAVFPDHEEAVSRTQELANRIDIDLDLNQKHYPVFTPPDNKTDTEFLRELCYERMKTRYPEEEVTDKHYERLDFELNVVDKMGYSSYFLIVWDFVVFAEDNKIPCQARGSACGAIVAYLLGLSNVCPLKYDLLFERFLDPSRAEPPDIDIDFCRDRRQLVIDYTKEKYGEENVAQIGTFGTLKAKAAIRDVSRALAIPLKRVDEICKMVPDQLNIKLAECLEQSAELKEAYDSEPEIREMFDNALKLEGLSRSAGTHAAGLVIADQELSEYIPLQRITGKTDIITQWDGPTVEMIGLLKMDFLGLRNLTILDKAVINVKNNAGVDIDPVKLPLDDQETFALLQRGETKGIFQLESGGMRDLLTKMKPDCFEDIIATSALYRPGPLEGGMVMDYVNVKNGRQEIAKVHPIVDEVLEETYGVMVYQEQVMRILNRVGDIPLTEAYKCIKAISKKKLKIIAQYLEQYIEGAIKNGIPEETAKNLFNLIEKFAGYGFNKSHSTAYGAVAYQTAYLKAHFPKEFMAALLSCGMESSDRISEHVDDCRRMKIEILPPNVNESKVDFGIKGDCLTFGLGAIKGVGEQALGIMVEERIKNGIFKDIFDLTERVDPKALTKGTLETLIKAGALDCFGPNRPQHLMVVERAVQGAISKQKDKAAGQMSLFGDSSSPSENSFEEEQIVLPEANDWTHSQKLAYEKEVFGFYLTSHPLQEYSDQISQYATNTFSDIADMEDGSEVLIGGMISAIKKAMTKKPSRNGHSKYVNFDFESADGIVRCIMWPEDYARMSELVVSDTICFVKAKIDKRGREPNLIVNKLITLDMATKIFTSQVAIKFQKGIHTEKDLIRVRDILNQYPGETEVVLIVDTADPEDTQMQIRYKLSPPASMRVSCSPKLRLELKEAIGPDHFRFYSPQQSKNGNGQSRVGST